MSNGTRKITIDEMAKVNGGYVVLDKEDENKFWIVRQDGSVIAPAPSLEKAQEFAKAFNVSSTVLTAEEYRNLFGRDLNW